MLTKEEAIAEASHTVLGTYPATAEKYYCLTEFYPALFSTYICSRWFLLLLFFFFFLKGSNGMLFTTPYCMHSTQKTAFFWSMPLIWGVSLIPSNCYCNSWLFCCKAYQADTKLKTAGFSALRRWKRPRPIEVSRLLSSIIPFILVAVLVGASLPTTSLPIYELWTFQKQNTWITEIWNWMVMMWLWRLWFINCWLKACSWL